jgi:5'-deoxynucleotidase YfbR-like HD superfamily hydrolase
MSTLEKLIQLTKLSNEFTLVQRAIYKPWTDRMENDWEHAYQVAFLAWQLNDMLSLGLDNALLLKYSVAHDIVEVYAWDTDAMGTVWDASTKKQREHEALIRLQNKYASFTTFVDVLLDYEHRQDEEARFVYALDKVIPMINIYLSGWRDWKEKKKSLQVVRAYKDSRIAEHKVIEEIYNEFIVLLEKDYDTYFNC